MRILQIITRCQLRGAETFAAQLSTHIMGMGHEVVMVALGKGDARLPFEGRIVKLDRPRSKRLIDVAGWRRLASIISEFNPDVVQANAGETLKYAALSKFFFRWRAPIVYRNANKVSDFIKKWHQRTFNKIMIGQVTHVVSVSETCRLDFVKTFSFPSDKTTTVPIGVEKIDRALALPSDLHAFFENHHVLVNAASFVPEKNHIGLLRIFARLLSRRSDVNLLLIGDGKLRREILDTIGQLGLSRHVLLAGYRNDVLEIFSRAAVAVLPSNIEGLPGVLLEAMCCGVPVVAYNVGGISEVVQNSKTGWLVDKGNEEAFVNAIEDVLEGHHTQSVVRNAKALVEQRYNNEILTREFLAIYEKHMRVNQDKKG